MTTTAIKKSILQRNTMIKSHHDEAGEHYAGAEDLAAELATAVYPMLLRHGLNDSWLTTELLVWKRLTRTIKRWNREGPPRTTPHELDALRQRLFTSDSDELVGRCAKAIEEGSGGNSVVSCTETRGRQQT
jgi:hypothetical protein